MEGENCALDGLDLAILAHASRHAGKPQPIELRKPRRLAALRAKGLLRSRRKGARTIHEATTLGNAAAALLESRPSIRHELDTPVHVRILAALYAFQQRRLDVTRPQLNWLTGASPNTFRRAFGALRNTNLILEPEGRIILNPDFAALHGFLAALEAESSHPPVALQPATAIHVAGTETAWRSPALAVTDLPRVANQDAFRGIVQSFAIQYRGPRRLDAWDHAFLFLLSDARRVDSGVEASARLKAAVMALMSPKLALNEDFEWRARFYGLESFAREARLVLTTPHPFRQVVDEHRTRFRVPGGWLDAR